MASPMNLGPDWCCLCFRPSGGGTFDLDDDGDSVALVLANVCPACRYWETRQLILLRSAYVGNGHPEGCECLECTHD